MILSSFRLICDFFQHTGLLTLSYCSTTLDTCASKLLLYQIHLNKYLSVYVRLWFVCVGNQINTFKHYSIEKEIILQQLFCHLQFQILRLIYLKYVLKYCEY